MPAWTEIYLFHFQFDGGSRVKYFTDVYRKYTNISKETLLVL
jgi:hypothetical protein